MVRLCNGTRTAVDTCCVDVQGVGAAELLTEYRRSLLQSTTPTSPPACWHCGDNEIILSMEDSFVGTLRVIITIERDQRHHWPLTLRQLLLCNRICCAVEKTKRLENMCRTDMQLTCTTASEGARGVLPPDINTQPANHSLAMQ